jgi:hypothetical protein
MKNISYGENRQLHEFGTPFLIVREPVHLEGQGWLPGLEIAVSHPNKAVGIAGGLEYSPCGLEFSLVEKLVPLAVELGLLLSGEPFAGRIGGLDEAIAGKSLENLFIHT